MVQAFEMGKFCGKALPVLWMWLGLAENDTRLGQLSKAVGKMGCLAAESDSAMLQVERNFPGSILERLGREASDPSVRLKLEAAPLDHGESANASRKLANISDVAPDIRMTAGCGVGVEGQWALQSSTDICKYDT